MSRPSSKGLGVGRRSTVALQGSQSLASSSRSLGSSPLLSGSASRMLDLGVSGSLSSLSSDLGSLEKPSRPSGVVGNAGTRSASMVELKDFRDRLSLTFTACTVSPLSTNGQKLSLGELLHEGVYRSKVELLDSWDPPTKRLEDYSTAEHSAATVIQAWFRGLMIRWKFQAVVSSRLRRSRLSVSRVSESRPSANRLSVPQVAQKAPAPGGRRSRKKGSAVSEASSAGKDSQRSSVEQRPSIFRKLCSAEETASQLREAFADSPAVLWKVALAMKEQQPLWALNLQSCCLGPENAERLSKALQSSDLRDLDLASCYIGDPGAGHVAANLQSSPHLMRLALAWNSVGDAGAVALAKSLVKMRSLKDLDLSYNRIGNEGAAALATVLHSTGLTSLALQANRIAKDGMTQLLKARPDRLTLQLDANNFPRESCSRQNSRQGIRPSHRPSSRGFVPEGKLSQALDG